MDGYLSKPIDVNELISTVERFAGGQASGPATAQMEVDGARLFDEHAALTYTGGDRELLGQVVGMFRTDAPASLRRIERALRRRDADALSLAAHAMKGAIATVGSPAGRAAAAELEQLARANQLESADQVFGRLEALIKQLDREFVAAGLAAPPTRRKVPRSKRRRPTTRRSRS
jgi:HPt (histidine-containing phosphotransfer) domain-containing protein